MVRQVERLAPGQRHVGAHARVARGRVVNTHELRDHHALGAAAAAEIEIGCSFNSNQLETFRKLIKQI